MASQLEGRSGMGITRSSGRFVRVEIVEDGEVAGSVVLDRRSAALAAWRILCAAMRKWR